MNEEERAEWLARAIDDLLRYDRLRPKEPPPPELDREELNALMRIASARVDSSNKLMHTGLLYEGDVWQTVLDRLDRRRFSREVKPFDATERANDAATTRALEQMEVDELREIARLRRELAEQASSIAEVHREDVWNRVQSRLQAEPERTRTFPFFRRAGPKGLAPEPGRGQRARSRVESAAEEVNGLMDLARTRRYGSRIVRKSARASQDRVWDRVSRSVLERGKRSAASKVPLSPRLAAVGAVIALVLAALAPLPATGVAGHPVVRALGSLAEHIGVTEVNRAPPGDAGAPRVVGGTEMTAADASERLGVRIATPDAPLGFERTSSRFFDESLTAASGGLFALTYVGPDGAAIVVYQEQDAGANLAAFSGSAVDVALADGTPATYFRGTWGTAAGAPAWSEDEAQTLTFEREGARTTVQYTGPQPDAGALFALADSMTPLD